MYISRKLVLNSIDLADLRLPGQKLQQGSCVFSCGVSSFVVFSSGSLKKAKPTGMFYETPDTVNVCWKCGIYNAEPLTALQCTWS